tara:strand:- start:2159 stop:2917 length:759 start_codon:yes stop_codon:yes gene_type:complete
MTDILTCISPIDGSVYAERPAAADADIQAALERAQACQAAWRNVPVAERAALCTAMVDVFIKEPEAVAEELARQMGRPARYGAGEVKGFEERARHMIAIAGEALADRPAPDKPGFTRFIRRMPLGVVLVVAPWNYPYLTAVNAIVPAIMAGNAVVLKHATQTPLCGERIARAFEAAGAPEGLFQVLHLTHGQTARVVASPEINFVAFTGSVPGGAAMEQAAAGRFIGLGLELGGKDPAYVRADANLAHASRT